MEDCENHPSLDARKMQKTRYPPFLCRFNLIFLWQLQAAKETRSKEEERALLHNHPSLTKKLVLSIKTGANPHNGSCVRSGSAINFLPVKWITVAADTT